MKDRPILEGRRKLAKRLIMFFFLVILTGIDFQFLAQFTPEELAERPKWERFLKSAKVVSAEDIGQGVTKPKRLFLKEGNIEAYAVWKSPSGTDAGTFDKWQAEVAAYIMDRLLGLNMVPPTVEKRYKGRKGSLQLWVTLETSELERTQQNVPIPADKAEQIEKMIYLQRAFDSLIANTDRSLQNIQYTKDWRLVLIDHSRSFRSTRIYIDQLVYGKNGIRKNLLFERLPRAFVNKIRSLSYETIRSAVGPYLTYAEVEAILSRKKLLLKEIDEMVKERGEDQVLY